MNEPRFLDTFERRLRLEGLLTTRTGLHIGAGSSGDPVGTDSPVVRDAAGKPVIPGSSLKGVVRSAAEALLRGAPSAALRVCNPIAKKGGCISHEALQKIQERHKKNEEEEDEADRKAAEDVWEKSCPICRLFGSSALASRVRFPDLPLAGEASPFEVRNGVGIDRDKELAASGVLYDFEAVPPETPFHLTVLLDNYTDAEAGLLLYLFEELDRGNLALGGKVSRGLGQVRIEWKNMEETTLAKDNPFANLLSRRELLETATDAEEVAEETTAVKLPGSGDAAAWQQLADLLAGLPEIDKGTLGKLAAEQGLTKKTLNQRLGLGLEGKQERRVWDVALDRLVECGFLTRSNGAYSVAGREEPAEEADFGKERREREPALQMVYDQYVGAMAQLWEEAH